MWIKITCSNCNSVFTVKEEFIWKKGKCPKCGNKIEIKVWNEEKKVVIKDKQGLFKNNKLIFKIIWIIVFLSIVIYFFNKEEVLSGSSIVSNEINDKVSNDNKRCAEMKSQCNICSIGENWIPRCTLSFCTDEKYTCTKYVERKIYKKEGLWDYKITFSESYFDWLDWIITSIKTKWKIINNNEIKINISLNKSFRNDDVVLNKIENFNINFYKTPENEFKKTIKYNNNFSLDLIVSKPAYYRYNMTYM